MDARAQQRLSVLTHVLAGRLTLHQAAAYLRLSERQVQGLIAGLVESRGAAVLVHGNRGRPPANRLDPGHRAAIVVLAKGPLGGLDAAHMVDVLAEEEPGLAVSARTLQRILRAEGLAPADTPRRPRHHRRRERMPMEGMLLQTDGSRHDWLEGGAPC